MKIVLLTLLVMMISSLVFAQGGSIALFADPAGNQCNLIDNVPSVPHTIYVFHLYFPGATACQFKIDWTPGMSMLLLGETVTAPYPWIGSAHDGIIIGFNGCVPTPNLLMTLQFFGLGTSSLCSYMRVVGDPIANPPGLNIADCANPPSILSASGGELVVNPTDLCDCDIPAGETSWGGIKSLYR